MKPVIGVIILTGKVHTITYHEAQTGSRYSSTLYLTSALDRGVLNATFRSLYSRE
jgi:hypothetical protein